MKKTTITMLCLAACFAAADTKITWLADVTADRAETVTGVQSNQIRDAAAHIVRTDNPHGVTAVQIGALTAELDPVANAALVGHMNRVDNPHGVTAAQIGALTNEQDLAALRAYHYGSPDIVESPAEWFVFDGAGTITAFNWEAGRTNVVIPWAIGGVPVTAIGGNAFVLSGIVSLIAPQTVTSIENSAFAGCGSLAYVLLPQVETIGNEAFYSCFSLAYVLLPQVETIGDNAFYYCISLTSFYFDNDAPTIGYEIFENITPGQIKIYVTNPQATGWGATFGGMPVVRLPLYADAIYQAGELVATTGHVAHASLADADGYTTQMVMRVGSEIATNRWGPRVTLPDGILTNGAKHVEFGASSPFPGYPNFNPPDSALSIFAPAKFIYVDSNVGGFWGIKFRGTGGGGFTDIFGFTANGQTGEIKLGSLWPTYYMSLMSGGETRVTLKKDGKVGIGTTAPSEIFEVVGSCKSSGTNTAAEVRSLGGYVIGPTISGKQARIFTDGTNCFFVNVNSVTNAAGGGETSIIAPLYESGTNVTVTSTQSVYSVAVTGAGPVGIDWSGLALDGTGRAEVTLRINVTEWGGTNVTFSPSLTFDRTPEILVTGVWEFAASTIDGVATRIRQTWPLTDEWATASYAYASGGWVASLQRMDVNHMLTNSLMCTCPPEPLLLIRPYMYANANKPVSFSYGFSAQYTPVTSVPAALYGPFSVYHGYRVGATHAVENPSEYGLVQIWVGNSSPETIASVLVYPSRTLIRPANANERAAYAAGWRP